MNLFQIDSLSQLSQAAKWVLKKVGNHKIIAFYGEMGAGKTTLIKEICNCINCCSHVTSPSFSIVNEYMINCNESVFHFDFYRLTNINEIINIGFEEYLYSNNYCLIEWPELAEPLLPPETQKIRINIDEKQKRILTFYV
ncbi:MAG: tRNA (adenosine(37)-N6)-threonylcarbamoyltransferase complex ATPase subunit type 1 TsaE [Bacteroidetes bacterium CG23_combo_of_CG06-09_8_20_14_all_32_9]|nr:MAG: tRNA (adenosine(37)-N6)-threonylcarbamoyltransferase complex ATPase subunit type 1 TsaE [Bacteroidetes bacterium CG23_combo_of_CG06-09_8_20_14_all_32_9]